MVKSNVQGVRDTKFFETGYIVIGKNVFDVEEISINQSRDLNPYHVASQRDPIDQRPGRNKIDFSFKRAFGDKIFLSLYKHACSFDIILFNNDVEGGEQIGTLRGCRSSQDNIGPINGGDIVSEDIQGSAKEFDLGNWKCVKQIICI